MCVPPQLGILWMGVAFERKHWRSFCCDTGIGNYELRFAKGERGDLKQARTMWAELVKA
jgi:hypothetical protein